MSTLPIKTPQTITKIPLKELKPYKNNPRLHNDVQIQRLINSLKEFGFTNPVLIDDEKNVIAGHGRLIAAERLNIDLIPTITLSHLTEEQRKAYIIADNQLALNSSWDDDLLQIELGNLLDNGFDLSVLGWGDDLPTFAEEPDYGLLDDIDDPNESLASNVYRGILLEFKPEDYEHARQLISDARKRGVYVGMKLIELLESIAE